MYKPEKMMKVKTLGSIATYINGRAFKPDEWEKEGLPIIRIQNLTDSNSSYNYSRQHFDEKFLVKNGDLLFVGQPHWEHIFGRAMTHGLINIFLK